jgi:hypothetical protein
MSIPLPRMRRHHTAETCVEEATFCSAGGDPSGEPRHTYPVRRIDTRDGWIYVVIMEVIAMQRGRILWEKPRRKGSIPAASLRGSGQPLTPHSPHRRPARAVDTIF